MKGFSKLSFGHHLTRLPVDVLWQVHLPGRKGEVIPEVFLFKPARFQKLPLMLPLKAAYFWHDAVHCVDHIWRGFRCTNL